MAQRPMLVVVIVRDDERRSRLAREISRAGVNLLTAASLHEGLIEQRLIREPSMLLIDEAEVAGDAGDWIEGQWLDRAWERVVMLAVDAPVPADDRSWLVYVDRYTPAEGIADLICQWSNQVRAKPLRGDRFEVLTVGSA